MITSFDHYECVGCGFIYPVELFRDAKYDYPCPKCGRWHLSSAIFVKPREEEVDMDWEIND